MFIHLVLQKLTCIANIYENIYINLANIQIIEPNQNNL